MFITQTVKRRHSSVRRSAVGKILDITPSNKELREALSSISIYDAKARLRIESAVETTVKEMARLAREKVPVRSGQLKKSIFSSFKKVGCTGYFGAKAPHAHLIEMGVSASQTKLKTKKLLKFNEGQTFIKSAEIPKRSERPFIRPAYEQERPAFIRRLAEAVRHK